MAVVEFLGGLFPVSFSFVESGQGFGENTVVYCPFLSDSRPKFSYDIDTELGNNCTKGKKG